MKSLSAIALLVAAGALSACDDKAPKPELETRPPAMEEIQRPQPDPGVAVPRPEPSPANLNPRP